MFKGCLIYEKEDAIKNENYINWFKEEAKNFDLDVKLIIKKQNILEELKELDFVVNRSRDYNLTLALTKNNVKVFNNYDFCLLGNDKILAYDFINKLNISYPKVYKTKDEILNVSNKIIVKPKNGHGGEGIKLFEKNDNIDFENFVYQEYIDNYIGDIRFYIINNKVISSVIRKPKGNSLVSNFTKGGNIEIYNMSNENKDIIDKILRRINIDYGGIDFLLLTNGEIHFNEFEDAVGSRMLSVLGINNTMDLFLKHISTTLRRKNEG